MKSDQLEAVRLKIKRAHKDIRKVDVAAHNFRFSKPYCFYSEVDSDGSQEIAKIRFTADIPDDLAADATSAVQNLRMALDNLAWAVANRSGSPTHPKTVRFPVHETRQGFEQPGTQGQIAQFGADWLKFINALKPYPGGNDLLYALHSLDVIEKHRDFIRYGGFSGPRAAVKGMKLGDDLTIRGLLGPLQDGAEIISYPIGNHPQIEISFDVAFRDIKPLDGEPVVSALNKLYALVVGIVNGANMRLFS